ncbi:MAG: flagellar biosynthesis protein FlhB [Pirellulales bacterium]|nr:flagellar biosynthesis protein FlhB [Pirellulales bacterium]
MPEQNGDKSQEPTPHRRQQAREHGQVAKSQDLASAVLLTVGVLVLLTLGGQVVHFFLDYTKRQLGETPHLHADVTFAVHSWTVLVLRLAQVMLPIFGLVLLAAVAANVMQIGFFFLPEKLLPDFGRISPLKGFGRIFSLSNVVHLAFGIFKIAVIAVVAYWCLWKQKDTILGLTALTVPEIARFLGEVLLWTTLKIGAALVALALLDFGFQWWKHEQDLRMTPQEVREEMKNLEGNPLLLSRRRQVQRQLAMTRLSAAVPKADVVITNPTELAVAVEYEPETMAAPIVVAKGAGAIAKRIRELALQHGVPLVEKKPLAQALYREVELNHPIPADKYAAVAEVLAYVYQLKGKTIPTPTRA